MQLLLCTAAVQAVHDECLKDEAVSELTELRKSVSVLTLAVEALVAASQAWAAVNHEWNVSRCVEVLQSYTDHVIAQHKDAQAQIKRLAA